MDSVRTPRSPMPAAALCAALVGLLLAGLHAEGPSSRRIAAFGSSVSFGTGDEYGREGYTGMLRGLLEPRGWTMLNQSRPGDTTTLLATRWAPAGTPDPRTPYLVTVDPRYVIIGLSLANEGILEAPTPSDKDAVFRQFADGIQGFVTKARDQHMVPVVTECYPRNAYTPVEYAYIRRMNLLENGWDVPTVNLLGSVDDGTGRWSKGFMFNDKHPNASGHREMMLAFVPTLFDALEQGKPTPVRAPADGGFARVSGGPAPLTFAPSSTMHSFAFGVTVRAGSDGVVAAIGGSTLSATSSMKTFGSGPSAVAFEEAVLTADRPFTSRAGVEQGKWTYTSSSGDRVVSAVPADRDWHHVVVSHYAARGETLFFVDGVLAGTAKERLEPGQFVVGGPGAAASGRAPTQADYRDALVFRSALNADEVAVLNGGRMLQASLEVYAPLADADFRPGAAVENRAQSLASLMVGGSIAHVGTAPGKVK